VSLSESECSSDGVLCCWSMRRESQIGLFVFSPVRVS
jgi:hypothetical protein